MSWRDPQSPGNVAVAPDARACRSLEAAPRLDQRGRVARATTCSIGQTGTSRDIAGTLGTGEALMLSSKSSDDQPANAKGAVGDDRSAGNDERQAESAGLKYTQRRYDLVIVSLAIALAALVSFVAGNLTDVIDFESSVNTNPSGSDASRPEQASSVDDINLYASRAAAGWGRWQRMLMSFQASKEKPPCELYGNLALRHQAW